MREAWTTPREGKDRQVHPSCRWSNLFADLAVFCAAESICLGGRECLDHQGAPARESPPEVELFAAFDDPDLIAHAGLVPTIRLAERCGLPALVAAKVKLAGAQNGAGTAACSDGCRNAQPRGPARASAPGTFQGLSALSEGLPRDFPPRNAASPRKTGKGLRRRSEALSQAKPQVAADESGCTPGSVPRFPRGGRGDGHPSRAGVATGLVRSTRGLGRAALERPRRALFTALLLTLLRVGFT